MERDLKRKDRKDGTTWYIDGYVFETMSKAKEYLVSDAVGFTQEEATKYLKTVWGRI